MNPDGSLLRCTVPLPAKFRSRDILSFHQRDRERLAERVDGTVIHKGLSWHGHPAHLQVALGERRADAQLSIDAADPGPAQSQAWRDELRRMVERLLGLRQPIERFESLYRAHALLGPLLSAQSGLRVPMAATPFEAISWAITGQQISVPVAVTLRRKLVQAAAIRHSSGIWCHPGPDAIVRLGTDVLRQASFSASKARTLVALSEAMLAGEAPLDDWLDDTPVEQMRERLLAIKGIGPWTVNYTLLRGYGWLDGSLHGDVAVRRGIQALTGADQRLDEAAARGWLEPFAPWRALLAAHLWAMQSPASY